MAKRKTAQDRILELYDENTALRCEISSLKNQIECSRVLNCDRIVDSGADRFGLLCKVKKLERELEEERRQNSILSGILRDIHERSR